MSPLTIYLRCALVVLLAGETVAAQVPRRAATAPLPAALVPATAVAVADTGQAFTLADLLAYVLLRHPVARQAGLLPARAAQEVRFARGQFDPAFASKYAGKTLGGTAYFHDWDTQLRVPLWFGADVKAGFERGTGAFVNPENYTAPAGLSYVGVSVPLAQGLLLDERRAAVRQAQALQGLAEAERRGALNKLLLQAAKDYWEWTLSYQRQELLRQRRVRTEQFVAGATSEPLERSSEQLAGVIAALAGGPAGRFVVNVPNQGQIDNLPRAAVVECMAEIGPLGLRPLAVGGLPHAAYAAIAPHIARQELIVEAALTGRRAPALAALASDPLLRDPANVAPLLDALLAANAEVGAALLT